MNKVLLSLLAVVVLSLGACATAPSGAAVAPVPAAVVAAAAKDSPITMANLDAFLFRSDVTVIDLRNFEERLNGGYIVGTESLPFFQYLEGRMVTRATVDGKANWDATLATVNESFPFANYFSKDRAIVLFCASGTRAAYIKTILDKRGYTTFNAGGFKEYAGANKVLGDGVYALPAPAAH